jgi:hypothetical protein
VQLFNTIVKTFAEMLLDLAQTQRIFAVSFSHRQCDIKSFQCEIQVIWRDWIVVHLVYTYYSPVLP